MILGALADLGVDIKAMQKALTSLGLKGFKVTARSVTRGLISGVKVDVAVDSAVRKKHHSRNFTDIQKMIRGSDLPDIVKSNAIEVFRRIAKAESEVHRVPVNKVHFHEVGAVDSIVDIVGACTALELLGKPLVLAGPVIEGTGTVRCAHGRFPLPAPATLEVLSARQIPIQQCDEPHELITPTGAALLAEFVGTFGPLVNFTPARIGYGLGTRENQTRPNVLRAVLGETSSSSAHDWESDTIAVLETNLDDINAEILGAFVEKALAAGALDVFHTPIQMKKSRPAVLLTVLCPGAESDRFAELILRETTAFGVRRHIADAGFRPARRRQDYSVIPDEMAA